MELTPLDLRNQTFRKKSFGGYDPEEVHAFLNQAAAEMEKQSRQRTELTERLKIAEERVGFYRQIEKTLQDSVLTMQKTVDESKHNAEREAELIVAEAKARAVREVEDTKKRATELRAEIEMLKQQRQNYFIRVRALIHSQEDLLQAMERDQTDLKAPEDLANEAMAFRNKRLEQASQRKTGAQPTVPATQTHPNTAAVSQQASHTQAQPSLVSSRNNIPPTQAIPAVKGPSAASQQTPADQWSSLLQPPPKK
ncbi:MAG TPA: DivIVA domain-containing protein [Fibrobacteraceae bacterium]|nr:DivIVA domain-containing protein [Fibrobacteraceae bacterium]